MSSESIQYYLQRLKSLRNTFQEFESSFKEIRKSLAPNTGKFETEQKKPKKKEQYYTSNINSMPFKYALTLSTMLMSNFTSPTSRWFRSSVKNRKMFRDEKAYFQNVDNVMYDVFEDANLHPTLHSVYFEAAVYGTGANYIVKDKKNGLSFLPLTIGEYYIEEDDKGVVNVLYRFLDLNLKQFVEKFGFDNLNDKYKQVYKNGSYDAIIRVWHSVEPNNKYRPSWENSYNKKFISCYFIEDENRKIEEKGISYFPYNVARWDKFGNSPYGTGIGVIVLGDIRMLQSYERDLSKASKKKILPPMRVDSNLSKQGINVGAGEATKTNNKDGITAIYQIQYDTNEARANIDSIQQRISEQFYYNVFFAMLGADKTMSATEAAARSAEKLQMLNGITTRWMKSLLEPIIETSYTILSEGDWFDAVPVPESLEGQNLSIDYHGLLFQAMDANDISTIERWFQSNNLLAASDPTVYDVSNSKEASKMIANKLDVPIEIINTDEFVEQKQVQRELSAQQQAQIEGTEAAVNASVAAKNLSQAGTTGENVLASMVGGGA